jgi:Zn-dependent M28 family amino/carboxypeptidase
MADVGWLTAPERSGRGSLQPASKVVADHLASRLSKLGYAVHRQPVADNVDNIIAVMRRGPKAVLVAAHYDHLGVDDRGVVYPGADDNASGVAVMLAMARDASAHPDRYRDSLVFIAFGAEEIGLVGSGIYIDKPHWPLEDTRALLNFDMVGRDFLEAASGKAATAAVIGLEDHQGAKAAAEEAAKRVGLSLVTAPAAMVELLGFHDRTDDWWFRRRGVLSIHFSTGLHPDYHQPTDTAEKLVPGQMSRIAKTAASLLVYLANLPE